MEWIFFWKFARKNKCQISGHHNWAEKTKPERAPTEQCQNATVQNDAKYGIRQNECMELGRIVEAMKRNKPENSCSGTHNGIQAARVIFWWLSVGKQSKLNWYQANDLSLTWCITKDTFSTEIISSQKLIRFILSAEISWNFMKIKICGFWFYLNDYVLFISSAINLLTYGRFLGP
jgi:hypothetical protein